MDKKVTIIIIILLVMPIILMFTGVVSGQSINPYAPDFTVSFNKASYNITTISNDGKTITQQIDNSTVDLIIKPYNYAVNESQYYIDPYSVPPKFHLYYDIQARKPSQQNWTDLYPLESKISNYATGEESLFISSRNNLPASNISDVKLTFQARTYPLGTDFQVRAVIGHGAIAFIPGKSYSPWGKNADNGTFVPAVLFDTYSNWSQSQTVSLPEPSPTPTLPIPTIKGVPDSDYLQRNLLVIMVVISGIIILSLVLLIRRKLRKNPKAYS